MFFRQKMDSIPWVSCLLNKERQPLMIQLMWNSPTFLIWAKINFSWNYASGNCVIQGQGVIDYFESEITYKIKNTFILSVDFMTKVHYSTSFERESVGGNVLAISCFTWTFSGYACIGISALIIILHLATLNTLEWLSYQKD